MDIGSVMTPIDRLIYMADNEALERLVARCEPNELSETIPPIREQLGNRLADTFSNAPVVTV